MKCFFFIPRSAIDENMKRLLCIFVAVLLIIASMVYIAYANASLILAELIGHKTHTTVTIEDINFHSKSFSIEKLRIANPKEARLPTAMKVETIGIEAPYKQYFWNPIIIDKIEMSDVYVNIQLYTKDQTQGNWQTILANMEQDHKSFFSVQREAIIKRLIFTNIQIDLILSDGRLHKLSPIERLEFDDVTSDKGIPTQEISEIIMQKMMHSIFLQQGLKTIIEAPATVIKGVLPFL